MEMRKHRKIRLFILLVVFLEEKPWLDCSKPWLKSVFQR